ncbi:MAG: hypothetical protein KAJ20_02220 [Candidatus Aenigmarchaeota archaeon]|nr:hypothetical protein [Candidatus Aenigmarchaeota archaeon]MCK5062296.1 hypothetical protein [Candidatus Aenigmarchaeota archaeon]MCK5234443.1 hypothetical protein [Candidatus Aenigmarchaeota archaeon]MCK5289541.1 hypothetical protein [Candidatus Aenigmarchaeota archaeon]MCK5373126.1 hypothetical protein [Candidatus Aenigmarchaeota archaeon]
MTECCCVKAKVRKGQFFVIGIVIILFSLTALNEILTQDRELELSYMQSDMTLFFIRQIESNLDNIISVVDHESIPDDIEEYLVYERDVLSKAGYSLNFEKDVTYIGDYPNNISINYIIKSAKVNMQREIRTNAWCLRYEYNGFCDLVGLATNGIVTQASCCSDFNLCC